MVFFFKCMLFFFNSAPIDREILDEDTKDQDSHICNHNRENSDLAF